MEEILLVSNVNYLIRMEFEECLKKYYKGSVLQSYNFHYFYII